MPVAQRLYRDKPYKRKRFLFLSGRFLVFILFFIVFTSHLTAATALLASDYYNDSGKPLAVSQGGVFILRLPTRYAKEGVNYAELSFHNRLKKGALPTVRRVPVYYQSDTQVWEALIPIEVSDSPGTATLSIFDHLGNTLMDMPINVLPGKFRRQNIQVSSQTKGLEPEPGELERVAKLKNETGSQKYWQLPLISPTPDCANSPFGVLRYHNGVYTGNYHKGLDFKSPMGRPVRATSAGDVKIAKKMRLHGGTVGLDHGQGLSSIYIHLSKILVTAGQHVKAGDVIGEVGATGFATGPHLHWGVFVNGVPINPLPWLPQAKTCF